MIYRMHKMTVTNTVYNISMVRKILKFIVQQFLIFHLSIAVEIQKVVENTRISQNRIIRDKSGE